MARPKRPPKPDASKKAPEKPSGGPRIRQATPDDPIFTRGFVIGWRPPRPGSKTEKPKSESEQR